MIAHRPSRRPLSRPALVRPAGYANPTFAPGRYDLTAVVEYARGTAVRPLANLNQNLDAALAAAGVGAGRARRAGDVTVAPSTGFGERRVVAYAAPLQVTATIPWRDLSRAMARAVFWSTDLMRDGVPVTRDPNDGGAYLEQLAENYPAEGGEARVERLVNVSVRAAPAPATPVRPSATAPALPPAPEPSSATPSRLPLVLGAGGLALAAWFLLRGRR